MSERPHRPVTRRLSVPKKTGEAPSRCQEVRLPQDRETQAKFERGQFPLLYAYARAAETRAAGDRGQDYLAFCEGEGSFVFALCDGVGQSFYGDLASRYLGDSLVAWLRDRLPETMDRETIAAALDDYLWEIVEPAKSLVERHPLPSDLPPLLREVLEEKRRLGSESTFACGRIDLPREGLPEGRIVLAWMGDSRLRLWNDRKQPVPLGGNFDIARRWSSHRGPVGGRPHCFVAPLRDGEQHVVRLMAYTDGLAALDGREKDLSRQTLQRMIEEAGSAATSDDIAFLEVWIEPSSVPGRTRSVPGAVPQRRPSGAETARQVSPRLKKDIPPPAKESVWLKGVAVALAAVVLMGIIAAALIVPKRGPLHNLVFGATPTTRGPVWDRNTPSRPGRVPPPPGGPGKGPRGTPGPPTETVPRTAPLGSPPPGPAGGFPPKASTVAPMVTPTATPFATVTPAVMPTGPPGLVPTATPIVTETQALTPTITPTVTGTWTPTPTITPTVTGTWTPTPTVVLTSAPTP